MEYRVVVDEDGVVNRYPILTNEEREERNQEFLKVAHEIIQKYKSKEPQDKKPRDLNEMGLCPECQSDWDRF